MVGMAVDIVGDAPDRVRVVRRPLRVDGERRSGGAPVDEHARQWRVGCDAGSWLSEGPQCVQTSAIEGKGAVGGDS